MPRSLFYTVPFPADAYCETFAASKHPRPHWRSLLAALDTRGEELLVQSQKRAERMRHEDGATFNPFDGTTARGMSWSPDVLPFLVTSQEWAGIEAGLIQRARLQEKLLADTYGPQELLQNGSIPPELIFANPGFVHQCHGVEPGGNRYLTSYAVDLYRGMDGRFRVLREYGGNPAGLGYVLENRLIMSRLFADLYQKTRIRRLAPFFQAFHSSLMERASLRKEDPGIVLLSPGPDSRIYFEHALLSRYLGYPLVEGQDLTVRNGRVFLKKLAGLEPVEAIIRYVDDGDSDPFALRRETITGVAGLIQACREQNVDIVNPIGSGFVDTPVLPVFLPALCRQLLGEELLLESHPSWWCGTLEGRDHVLSDTGTLQIAPALDRRAVIDGSEDVRAAISAAPHMYMASEPVMPSVALAWDGTAVCSRFTVLRVFVCASAEGFTVMPGGMAITASDVATVTGDRFDRQQCKDIWVLSDQPVEPFTLMDALRSEPKFRRSSDLPSRVADHLLWLGRYLERAEGVIRLLRSVLRRISGEARLEEITELPFLLNLLFSENIFPRSVCQGDELPSYPDLIACLHEALYSSDRPESVVSILERVQVAGRNVRDRLSLDSWRVLSRLEDFSETRPDDSLEFLDEMLFTLSAFSGLAMESMTRGLGWCFLDMGRRLERGMNLARLIRIGLPRTCLAPGTALEALLEVSDSIITYRGRYRKAFHLAPVLDLLLADETNPKSLAFQCSMLATHVGQLPQEEERRFACAEERLSLEMLTAVRLLDLEDMRCGEDRAPKEGLVNFLESMENLLNSFALQVGGHYLARVPATPHYAILPGSRTL